MQKDKDVNFSDFKMALRSFEETMRSRSDQGGASGESVMVTRSGGVGRKPGNFSGKCFSCHEFGHRSSQGCRNYVCNVCIAHLALQIIYFACALCVQRFGASVQFCPTTTIISS